MSQIRSTVRRTAVGLWLVLPLLAACKKSSDAGGDVARTWKPKNPNEVLGVQLAAVQTALRQRLEGARPSRIDDDQWKHVQTLYKHFSASPLWLSSDGLDKARTKALADGILNAHQDGMRLDAYPVGEVAQAIGTLRQGRQATADELADADVLLTSTFVALAEDYLTGQVDPRTVSQSWHIDPQEEAVDSALSRSIRTEQLDVALAEMRPTDDDYRTLAANLERFRKVVVSGGWGTIPAGKAVRPGQRDDPARLAALRTRLRLEGVLGGDSTATQAGRQQGDQPAAQPLPQAGSGIYDRELAAAVAQFQTRHGIAVDSMLGPETVKSLNIPAEYRLGQIAANLERFRWLPRSFGSRYIMVNVPAFRVEAYDQGKKALEMKVIVGQEYDDKATPVFADSMEMVVFRPYWNVTPDIQSKELEPKIAANPGYMEANDYEYWNDGGARRIRQRPGPKNSLGLVKFLFPNSFNIYLHDTPNDELFKKDVRALSHGCIRLEKPDQMAQWVLGWDAAKVSEAMNASTNNRTVRLPKKIPVYIAYFTAYTRDGHLMFGNDIYDRDDTMIPVVMPGAMPTTQTVEAVQALRRVAEKI